MRKTILYGAFGRHNFGDILFPHILTSLLESNLIETEIIYCDVRSVNMTKYGGHKVKSITGFLGYKKDINLIAVGGHTANDCNPIVFFNKFTRKLLKRKFYREQFSPSYILDKNAFKSPGIFIANSLGGFSNSGANKLKDYDFVSIRNLNSHKQATNFGINALFAPDCVVLLKYFFDNTIIERDYKSKKIRKLQTLHSKNYIAVQLNTRLILEHGQVITNQLIDIVKKINLPIVFFCAGIAPLHDSMSLYKKKFNNLFPNNKVYFFDGLNIWDVCNVIANARFVIGTSLHVRIVSAVYNRPRVTLFSDHADNKAKEFIDQWDVISQYNEDISLTKYIENELNEHDYDADQKQLKFLETQYLEKSTWLNLLK